MHRRGRDARTPQTAGQLDGEHDVGELGLVVGTLSGVVASALQVVEVDAAQALCAGRNRDDPRRCAGFEPIKEQVGEEERRQVVEGKRVLLAIGRQVPVRPEPADVVHQHIQPRVGVEDSDG